jgi:hypothetical protein
MEIFFVSFKVITQAIDPLGEYCYLHLGRTGIPGVSLKVFN